VNPNVLQGYGFSTLPNTRATPETLWLGGSTTKAYVAATLAHLIDSENYTALSSGWSTPISSILPDDFVLQEEWSTKHITLEDAASHRTGMPRHDFSWARSVNGKPVTNKDNVRNLRNLPPTAQPRTVFQYCNLMYLTLSHVVETLTGNRVDDVINKVIWTPLGMNNTYMDLEAAKDNPNPMATGYFWDDSKNDYTAIPEDLVQHSSGAGAIISNVLDYAKWVECLLDEAAPFSKKTHRDIRTPRMLETSMPTSGFDVNLYGLGWERTIFHGEVLYKHGGTTAAFSANIYWMPDLKYAIVSFSNVAGIGNSVEEIVSRKLVEDKLQVPQRDRVDYGQE
jgi:CubicO group peptidase (beta-lactamase class C family)